MQSPKQALTGSLRGYQNLIIKSVFDHYQRGNNTALIVAPTGSGKTVTFTALVHEFLKQAQHIRVVFMINRVQLVKQLHKVLLSEGLDCGIACGSLGLRELNNQFTIASYLSLINICPPFLYNLIIWDEAHTFAPLLDDNNTPLAHWYRAVKEVNPKVRDIGFTATPYTATSLIYGEGKHFKGITHEVYMKELLGQKHLVEAKAYSGPPASRFKLKGLKTVGGDYQLVDLQKLAESESLMASQVADALTHLNSHDRRCVVWQCVGIDHCELVASRLRECGETVAVVHSETEYTQELQEFEQGLRRHLVFVTIVAVGYDHPPVDAIVILRPTKSPVLMVQSVGRTLRTSTQKTYALVLDYGEVIRNCGPIDYPFIRQRADHVEAKNKNPEASLDLDPVVECLQCGHIQFVVIELGVKCAECGDDLYGQLKKDQREKTASSLAKKAAKYESLYSDINVVQVYKMTGKWKLSQDLSHLITLTYNDKYSEVFYVGPFDSLDKMNKTRLGQLKRAMARMKLVGCVGESLREMALSQRIIYMPEAIIVADNKVIEISGSQLIPEEPIIPQQLSEPRPVDQLSLV